MVGISFKSRLFGRKTMASSSTSPTRTTSTYRFEVFNRNGPKKVKVMKTANLTKARITACRMAKANQELGYGAVTIYKVNKTGGVSEEGYIQYTYDNKTRESRYTLTDNSNHYLINPTTGKLSKDPLYIRLA